MRFLKSGNFTLDKSGNVVEIFATGAWDLATTEAMMEEVHSLTQDLAHQPWGVLIDCRRWVLTTPECQNAMAKGIRHQIDRGLSRTAYVMDSGMVKRAQIERTHPDFRQHQQDQCYQREYFYSYFKALKWLETQGFTP